MSDAATQARLVLEVEADGARRDALHALDRAEAGIRDLRACLSSVHIIDVHGERALSLINALLAVQRCASITLALRLMGKGEP